MGSTGPGDGAAEIDPRRADSPGETIDPYAVGSEEVPEDAEDAEFWNSWLGVEETASDYVEEP